MHRRRQGLRAGKGHRSNPLLQMGEQLSKVSDMRSERGINSHRPNTWCARYTEKLASYFFSTDTSITIHSCFPMAFL